MLFYYGMLFVHLPNYWSTHSRNAGSGQQLPWNPTTRAGQLARFLILALPFPLPVGCWLSFLLFVLRNIYLPTAILNFVSDSMRFVVRLLRHKGYGFVVSKSRLIFRLGLAEFTDLKMKCDLKFRMFYLLIYKLLMITKIHRTCTCVSTTWRPPANCWKRAPISAPSRTLPTLNRCFSLAKDWWVGSRVVHYFWFKKKTTKIKYFWGFCLTQIPTQNTIGIYHPKYR